MVCLLIIFVECLLNVPNLKENLKNTFEAEKTEKKILTRVPFHYIEIAFELLLVYEKSY